MPESIIDLPNRSFFKIELRVLQSTAKDNEAFLNAVADIFARHDAKMDDQDLKITDLHKALKTTRDALDAFENTMIAAGGYIDTSNDRDALDAARAMAVAALISTDRF